LKPRLRGVFHQYAFYVAVVAGAVLVGLSDSEREFVATWIYAVALASMFGVSALYHRVNWRSARVRMWMRRLDHSTILLLIAGTYTPFALLAFDGRIGDITLVVVWCGAAAGLVLNLAWIDAPKWLTALVFIALGWVGIAAVPELLDLGVTPTVLVFVGGGSMLSGDPDAMLAGGTCATVIAAFLAVLSIPNIIAGVGLQKRREWARILTIVLSVLHLFNFPLGTALGAYAMWALLNDQSKAYFAR